VSIRTFVPVSSPNTSNAESHRPSTQKCDSGRVIQQLAVIERTSNSSCSLASAQPRSRNRHRHPHPHLHPHRPPSLCCKVDGCFRCFFGRMKECRNPTKFSARRCDGRLNVTVVNYCFRRPIQFPNVLDEAFEPERHQTNEMMTSRQPTLSRGRLSSLPRKWNRMWKKASGRRRERRTEGRKMK
jgi:hypothetical protein